MALHITSELEHTIADCLLSLRNSMSRRRMNDSVSIAPYEYAAVYEYLGKNRYLQASFCKSVQQLYSAMSGSITSTSLSNIAAEEGRIGLLTWSKGIGCRWDDSVFMSGAKGGHVDVIRYLVDNDCPIPRRRDVLWIAAAERGHVGVLKFAHNSRYIYDMRRLCEVAAENGQLDILKWIYEIEGNIYFDADTCKLAAMGGFIESIQWLRSVGCDWNSGACKAAVEKGRLDMLKWLISNGCFWILSPSLLDIAAHMGHTEIMSYLINDCHANVDYIAYGLSPLSNAIIGGHVEAVKLLLDSGADIGKNALSFARSRGLNEIAQVLRDAGAPE